MPPSGGPRLPKYRVQVERPPDGTLVNILADAWTVDEHGHLWLWADGKAFAVIASSEWAAVRQHPLLTLVKLPEPPR
jgi:hypothetical protein